MTKVWIMPDEAIVPLARVVARPKYPAPRAHRPRVESWRVVSMVVGFVATFAAGVVVGVLVVLS